MTVLVEESRTELAPASYSANGMASVVPIDSHRILELWSGPAGADHNVSLRIVDFATGPAVVTGETVLQGSAEPLWPTSPSPFHTTFGPMVATVLTPTLGVLLWGYNQKQVRARPIDLSGPAPVLGPASTVRYVDPATTALTDFTDPAMPNSVQFYDNTIEIVAVAPGRVIAFAPAQDQDSLGPVVVARSLLVSPGGVAVDGPWHTAYFDSTRNNSFALASVPAFGGDRVAIGLDQATVPAVSAPVSNLAAWVAGTDLTLPPRTPDLNEQGRGLGSSGGVLTVAVGTDVVLSEAGASLTLSAPSVPVWSLWDVGTAGLGLGGAVVIGSSGSSAVYWKTVGSAPPPPPPDRPRGQFRTSPGPGQGFFL